MKREAILRGEAGDVSDCEMIRRVGGFYGGILFG